MISGFLISTIIMGSLDSNSFSFIEFYSRRIKRIFPALLLVLIASILFGWLTLLSDEYQQLGKHIAGGAGFISNFLFWNESGYFDNAAETKPLLHLWSLGIEEQFYIVWPLILWLVGNAKFNLLVFIVVVGVISFSLNIEVVQSDEVAAFYLPQTRFWELLAGSFLAYMSLQRTFLLPKFKFKLDALINKVNHAQTPQINCKYFHNAQSILGAILILAGLLIITKARLFPGWWALMPTLGAMLIISAGPQAWFNRVVLSNRVLVGFGLISFPLYLWHWPLLAFTHIIFNHTPSYIIRIVVVSISMVLAWLTYQFIEKPIRVGKYSKAKTVALFIAMIVVGYVGYTIYNLHGLGFRFPKIMQGIIQLNYDYKKAYREGTCFLRPEQDFTAFNSCESESGEDKKPTILLWGDSHAAHLYPGYKISFGEKYHIIQRTASMCPPILNLDINDRPHCREINDQTLKLIKNKKPQKIVLAANWGSYDWKKIEVTISHLREMGVNKIDLIGPVPQWNMSLNKLLYLKYISDKSHQIPYRMKFGLNLNFIQLDAIMYDFSFRLGINYISPNKIMCNETGCIARFGEAGETLAAWDRTHLTEISSRYLVSQFPKN